MPAQSPILITAKCILVGVPRNHLYGGKRGSKQFDLGEIQLGKFALDLPYQLATKSTPERQNSLNIRYHEFKNKNCVALSGMLTDSLSDADSSEPNPALKFRTTRSVGVGK